MEVSLDRKPGVDNKFARQFGFPKTKPAGKVKDYLSKNEKEFIRQSPFL